MKYFGTDGIRGVVGSTLTPKLAYLVGRSLASFFGEGRTAIIGIDTRISGNLIMLSLSAGLVEGGVNVKFVGVVSTPSLAFLTRQENFDFGIMITASHNPPEYNGIKIFNSSGEKLEEQIEREIEKLITYQNFNERTSLRYGSFKENKPLVNKYINYLVDFAKDLKNLPLKICIDCANGASSKIVKKLVKKLNLNAFVINTSSDGLKVNKNCGSTNLSPLLKLAQKEHFDAIFSFDGDADRILTIDENGEVRDGDDIMYAVALNLFRLNKLTKNTVVATEISNFGLDTTLKAKNILVERVKNGDFNVYSRLKQKDLCFGGERTGHLIYTPHISSGDGVYIMLTLLNIMKSQHKKFSELFSGLKKFNLVERNIKISALQKEKLFNSIDFKKFIYSCDEQLVKDGRLLVRPSGTENVARVLVECKSEQKARDIANEISAYIEKFCDI